MNTVIVDTNLLSLLVVGSANRAGVAKHKRLRAFTLEDYDNVTALISDYPQVVLCPHVLTETSNIIRQTTDPLKSQASAMLATFVAAYDEQNVSAAIATRHPHYLRLGLADAVLLTLAEMDALLLTVDLDLYLAAESAGYPVVNYNHLRDE